MSLEIFAKKLQKDGVGRLGKNIFVGHAPDGADRWILLRDTYGGEPIDYELPNYHKVKFHGIVWSKTYKEGEALAMKMSNSLTLMETTLENLDVRYVRPRNRPVTYPLSNGAAFEFLVIFEAVYVIV